jgi:hypothetical protein
MVFPHILAAAARELAEPVSLLFARSLADGKTPKEWKRATVTPVFEKGSRSLASNYRPVSLTCIMCKVMEQL